MSHVGAVVRARRRALRLTLGEVAHRASCSKGYLSAIETGRQRHPSEVVLGRLETALEVEHGRLILICAYARTPAVVRRELERLRRGAGSGERGVAVLARADGSYAFGPDDPDAVATGERVAWSGAGCDAFAVRMRDDAMSPDILAGDAVVFAPGRAVRSGDDCIGAVGPGGAVVVGRVFLGEGPSGGARVQALDVRVEPTLLSRRRVMELRPAVAVIRERARRPVVSLD